MFESRPECFENRRFAVSKNLTLTSIGLIVAVLLAALLAKEFSNTRMAARRTQAK